MITATLRSIRKVGDSAAHPAGKRMTATLRPRGTVARSPKHLGGRESAGRIAAIRILIVDDDREVARGLAWQLRLRGHRVDCAYSGATALKIAYAFQPEFVVVGAALPDLSGYEIAALLPAICPARLRVVSHSEDGGEEDGGLSRAAGCARHLRRPAAIVEIDTMPGNMQRESGGAGKVGRPPESGRERADFLPPSEAGEKAEGASKRPVPGTLTREDGGQKLRPRGMTYPQGNPRFPTTCWTGVLRLRGTGDQDLRKEALANLCRDYWHPLYAFVRRQGRSQEDAEDLTQGFFAYALEHEVFGLADRERGTLRTFLLRIFQRYNGGVRDREQAQKRGGGLELVSLNLDDGEALYARDLATEDSPEVVYDRTWAQALLRTAVASLAASEKDAGREQQFAVLQTFLTPVGVAEQGHETAASELGMTAEAARQAVSRLRKKFRVSLREQIAATLQEPDDARIDAELHALKAALSR